MQVSLYRMEMYVVALLLNATTLLYTYLQKRTDKRQNKLFIGVNFILLTNILSSIIAEYAKPACLTSDLAFQIRDIMEYCYFVIHAMICPFFAMYVFNVVGKRQKKKWYHNLLISGMFFVTEFIAVSNPITHWVYSFDADRQFSREWGVYSIYLAAAFYYLYAIYTLMSSWSALTRKRRYSMIYFFLMVASGVVIQMLNIEIRSELVSEALGLLGVMNSIENEDDRIDKDTGFYNRKALLTDIKSHIVNRRRLTVLNVRIINPEIVRRATGSYNMDVLSEILADYLKSVIPRYQIYNATPESFILTLIDAQAGDSATIAAKVSQRFDSPFKLKDTEIMLKAVILIANVPGELKTEDAVLEMAEQELPAKIDRNVLCGADLDYLLRRAAVEDAVNRGLAAKRFEVYYQPTFYMDGTLHGAEALLRLNDSIIGMVYPDEFIPAAERMGLIHELDNFVFAEVCQFLLSGLPEKFGMDCINVNLSVLHCMQPDFLLQLNGIVQEYRVDKRYVNFEITESAASNDYDLLSNIVNSLKAEGYRISMDDYGTGYSNMETISKLDFDVVKIDKSILWNAQKSQIGSIVLENTVRMVRQMDRKILVEGVETKAQIELLKNLGVDYLQGFYFSKPVPKEEFIAYVSSRAAHPS